jgi:hypothetical protein
MRCAVALCQRRRHSERRRLSLGTFVCRSRCVLWRCGRGASHVLAHVTARIIAAQLGQTQTDLRRLFEEQSYLIDLCRPFWHAAWRLIGFNSQGLSLTNVFLEAVVAIRGSYKAHMTLRSRDATRQLVAISILSSFSCFLIDDFDAAVGDGAFAAATRACECARSQQSRLHSRASLAHSRAQNAT